MKKSILIPVTIALIFSLTNKASAVIVEQGCDCGENCCYTIDDKKNLVLTLAEGADEATIGDYAFQEKHLNSITIAEGFTSIGYYGLHGNDFQSVELPDTMNTVGVDAFNSNKMLSKINIPNSVKTIGAWAFSGATSLTSIELPDGLETIGFGAFRYSGLKSLTIPESVTKVGVRLFAGATALTEVIIPENINTNEWDNRMFENANENLKIYCQGDVDVCKQKLAKYIPDENGNCSVGTSYCLKNPTFTKATDSRCNTHGYYYTGSECIKEPDAAKRTCEYKQTGYIKIGDYCYSPEVTYAKKHYTPAEANQWLKDDDNFVVITFKK